MATAFWQQSRGLIAFVSRNAKYLGVSANKTQVIRKRLISTSLSFSSERKFTEKHEWVHLNGNIGTVGISDYAQFESGYRGSRIDKLTPFINEALGDIVYAQLPDVGAEFEQNDECGALESVKAASDIYSPVSGTVTAKNTDVEEKPEIINKSCYDSGWLFKIELSKLDEMDDLMTEEAYAEYQRSQE